MYSPAADDYRVQPFSVCFGNNAQLYPAVAARAEVRIGNTFTGTGLLFDVKARQRTGKPFQRGRGPGSCGHAQPKVDSTTAAVYR